MPRGPAQYAIVKSFINSFSGEAHLTDGHISFTTNIQQMSVKDVTQDVRKPFIRSLEEQYYSVDSIRHSIMDTFSLFFIRLFI